MRIGDVAIFGNRAKDAVLKWSDQMVDNLMPNSAARRTIIKNAIDNAMKRYGQQVGKGTESIFMLLSDKSGNIDTDTMVDTLCEMLKEMRPTDYDFGFINARVGNGEVQVRFPDGFISEFVFGDIGGFKITPDDILEIKKFFND